MSIMFPSHDRRARKNTGLDITPYTARHTVSTNLIWPCGVGEIVKDEILGHAGTNDMSKHYTHLPRQPLIDAINKLPWPDGLRADLIEPDKIRAMHKETYKGKSSKTVTGS
jgi:integrase